MRNHQIGNAVGRARLLGGSAAAAAVVAALAIGGALMPLGPNGAATAETMPRATTMTGMLPADFTEVIERVSPAVVNVQVTQTAEEGPSPRGMPKGMEEFFKRFFGDQLPEGFRFHGPEGEQGGPQAPQRQMRGLGSGFLIDREGYIVTNNHVVGDKGAKLTVTLQDGKSHDAKVIGRDPETDLALIKIEAGRPLPFVKFSEDPTPRPGRWVIAVGNPFGLDHTATAGIVSATGRAIGTGPYDDFIQIDAPINRGNSGGPTFNLKGEVVGVNTAIFSPSGGSVGIGFAIPANIATDVISQLREKGHVERGWLGVEVQAVTPDIAQSLGLDSPKGAIVARIVPDSPARTAGLQQGDVVLSVNGKEIGKLGDLTRRIADLKPGSTAKLQVMRGDETRTVSVKLATRPSQDKLAAAQSPQPGEGEESGTSLGMSLATLDDATRQSFGLGADVRGAVITEVDPKGAAAAKNLEPGDVIVAVGNTRVRSAQEAAKQIEAAKTSGRKAVLVLVHKQGAERFVALPIG